MSEPLREDESAARFLKWFATVTPRRTFLAQLGRGFAWLVGASVVGRAAHVWDPEGNAQAAPPDPATLTGPWKKEADGGPKKDKKIGSGPGCARKDQRGMHGCDCICMYGINDCPADGPDDPAHPHTAPGGDFTSPGADGKSTVWCYCVDIGEAGMPKIRELCYADCFGKGANGKNRDHEDLLKCKNREGRLCYCTGKQTDHMADGQWPSPATEPDPANQLYYDCTRVIDFTGSGHPNNDAGTQWFPTENGVGQLPGSNLYALYNIEPPPDGGG